MYNGIASYATVKGIKIPSFEEYLGLGSEEGATTFSSDTDQKLEAYALNKVKNGGQRTSNKN